MQPENQDSSASTPTEQNSTPPVAPQTESSTRKPFPKKILIIIVLFVVTVSAILAYFFTGQQETKTTTADNAVSEDLQPTLIPQKDPNSVQSSNPQALSRLLVYGSWNGQASLIKAVDLSSQKTTLVATLPLAIKKVSILSEQSLLYIDQTDTRDHGKQLVLFDIKSKTQTATIPAASGFGIDDYVLSPDKKYVAIWEVAFAPNTEILQGGKSRVYAVDLSRPTVKKLLFDETAGPEAPVHYPRAILNNGRVFADKFLPNDPNGGAGWAYGMSVVEFDGTGKKALGTMQHGTYGTQPSLSSDGKYLVFAGYDGSRGDGKAVNNGYRQALLTPNSVELLDTATLARQKLPNLDNKKSYTGASWDTITGNIILTILSKERDQTGTFSYALASKSLQKVAIPKTQGSVYKYISGLSGEQTLIGMSENKDSNLGNLGDGYAYGLTKIAVLDNKNTVSNIQLQDTYAQYITLLPTNYFKTVLGEKIAQATTFQPTIIDQYSDKNSPKQNVQLYTFFLKAALAPTRLKQQSSTIAPQLSPQISQSAQNTPPAPGQNCQLLAESQCKAQGLTSSSSGWQDCITANREDPVVKCSDSPLYLYGAAGKRVQVTIHTPIYNAVPSSTGNYDITLGENGTMSINDQEHVRIAYDYQSNLKRIKAPTRGAIVHKNRVENILREYAGKLDLNEKETADLVIAGKSKTTAEYVFVSFFDQKTSEAILPISFSPEPDNYLNVVFYFKNLAGKPNYTPLPPVFSDPVKRTGFTAVEVSEMVE